MRRRPSSDVGDLGESASPFDREPDDPELRLYRPLTTSDPRGAYSRYNALLREIVSFARALERER